MQQTLEHKGWFAAARCNGIFRYHYRSLGKIVAWVLAVTLGSGILSILFPIIFVSTEGSRYGGISSDIAITVLVTLICGNIVANRSTRFLLRFGTPRFSVWLCNVLSLLAGMLVLLLGVLVLNTALAYLELLLRGNMTVFDPWISGGREVAYDAAYLGGSLSRAIADLPGQMLTIAEYVCIFYLLACCLRRRKGLTLTIVLGVPFALLMLTIVPAVRESIDIAMGGNQGELMMAGLQWMQWILDFTRFLRDEWPTVLFLTAVASLPLSYLCMRGTKQP